MIGIFIYFFAYNKYIDPIMLVLWLFSVLWCQAYAAVDRGVLNTDGSPAGTPGTPGTSGTPGTPGTSGTPSASGTPGSSDTSDTSGTPGTVDAWTFDLMEFEDRHFPRTVELTVDGVHVLRLNTDTYIGERVAHYCDSLLVNVGQCDEIFNTLEKLMFNPRAVVYDIESFRQTGRLQPSFPAVPVVQKSSRANHEFYCLALDEGGIPADCVAVDDGVFKSRELFSRFAISEVVRMRRVVFIHSVLLQHAATESDQAGLRLSVLEMLLGRLVGTPGLLAGLDRIFVLNYGQTLPTNFTQTFEELCAHKVTFFQYSVDITRYEVPTLQAMHYFSKLSRDLRVQSGIDGDSQVLYLHTKGVSYLEDHPEIRDWRDYMLYFLVERWGNATATLAAADAIDPTSVVGVYLRPCLCADPFGGRQVSLGSYCWCYIGNYWWASSNYLASLPTLSIERNDKYDCEKWVTAGYHRHPESHQFNPKTYNETAVLRAEGLVSLHTSGIDHYVNTYPRELYALT